MKLQDALNILSLSGDGITLEQCREAYRRASMKYHPDRNPGGLQMMQAVNAAWAFLQTWRWGEGEPVNVQPGANADYGDALMAAINATVSLSGITLEVCGSWIWVTGNTYPHKTVFKQAGFMWASKKKQWYFRPPEWRSSNRGGEWDMETIRECYGSEAVNPDQAKGQGSGQPQRIH